MGEKRLGKTKIDIGNAEQYPCYGDRAHLEIVVAQVTSEKAHGHEVEQQQYGQPDDTPLGEGIQEFVMRVAELKDDGVYYSGLGQFRHPILIPQLPPPKNRFFHDEISSAFPHLESCAQRTTLRLT